jgi:LacI family transcriptional regulator
VKKSAIITVNVPGNIPDNVPKQPFLALFLLLPSQLDIERLAMNGKPRVPIHQVAREAGVSIQTVSRVTNNHPDVAPETRQRVLEVIERLGYQPSRIARAMRGYSRTIGVIGWGLEYFGPSRALSGIELRASELGFTFILNLVRQPETYDAGRILEDMFSRHVDGFIWAIPEIGDNMRQVKEKAPDLPIPIVFTDAEPGPSIHVVENDNRMGGKLAVEHLLAQGYRTIGLITGPLPWRSARLRHQAWSEALVAAGLPDDGSLVEAGDWSAASGALALRRLLARRPDIDAVFVCNDQMALGAIQTTRQLGLRVPEDLALIGYDDVPEAGFFCPPLSSVAQPMLELGRMAVDVLVKRIEAQQAGQTVEPGLHTIQPALVVRESSAAKKTVAPEAAGR